eukprot:m.8649 g.8649  ORF g.8649 m.8649 type:complete len:228 (+) comp5258_c0_seq1:77-760(+)
MDDQEVNKQIKHMVAFIEQEAKEKAEEILVKANEEFEVEKVRLVQQEKKKINAQYERKEKMVETEKKIQHSKALNQARVEVLQTQEELLKGIFADAQDRLTQISKDKGKYKDILKNLLLEGLLVLLEEHVTVQVRKADGDVIKGMFGEVAKKFKETTHKNVELTLDTDNELPESSGGGVVLSAHKGKIKVKNTLKDRITFVTDKILPAVRLKLFGVSETRTFFDKVM